MTQQLAEIPATSTALATHNTNPIAPMLEAITAKGITTESAATLEKMIDMWERVEAKNAERAFAAAFVGLQDDISRAGIQAVKGVPGRDGAVKYMFAPYEEIWPKVAPLLTRHGFGVSWDCKIDGPRVVMICKLKHTSGHEQINSFGARIGSGPPNASEAQSDGAAGTYAKRRALCDALNIVAEHDTDARSEGDTISQECADDLQRRVRALGGDEAKFLKLANAATFSEVRSVKYGILIAAIEERERSQPAPDFADPAKWRATMLELFAERGARQPAAAFDAALAKSGADKFTDVPEPRRVAAWRALRAGKLDVFLAAEVVDRGAGLGGESRPPR